MKLCHRNLSSISREAVREHILEVVAEREEEVANSKREAEKARNQIQITVHHGSIHASVKTPRTVTLESLLEQLHPAFGLKRIWSCVGGLQVMMMTSIRLFRVVDRTCPWTDYACSPSTRNCLLTPSRAR